MDYAQSVLMALPEVIITLGALVLLLVAAYAGDKATRAVSWLAVLVLAGASVSLLGLPGNGGEAFHGLYRADGFAAFSKLLIYIAAAVSIAIARADSPY